MAWDLSVNAIPVFAFISPLRYEDIGSTGAIRKSILNSCELCEKLCELCG